MTMQSEQNPYELSFRDVIRVIFRKQLIILTVFILSLLGAYVYVNMTVPTFATSTKILVSSARETVAPFYTELGPLRRAQPNVTQGEVIRAGIVLEEVVKALQLDQRDDEIKFYPRLKKILQPKIDAIIDMAKKTYEFIKIKIFGGEPSRNELSKFDAAVEALRLSVKVDQVEDSDVFYLNVTDYNPQMASRIAHAIARQYIIFDIQQQVLNLSTRYGNMYPKIIQLKESIQNIQLSGEQMSSEELNSIGLATIKIVDSAKVPYKPSKPKQRIIYILTVIMGLIGGISLALSTAGMDATIQNPWELEQQSGTPVVCSVPRRGNFCFPASRLITNVKGKGMYATAYNRLADHLYRLIVEKDVRVLTLADLGDSRNSGINAFNIGHLLANFYNVKTLLIDADFRNPQLDKVLRLSNASGLFDVLAGRVSLKSIEMAHSEGLDILPTGNTDNNPLVLLAGDDMRHLINHFKEQYDAVIIHAPSLMQYHDPVIVGRQTQGMVVSIQEGRVKKEIAGNIFVALKKEGISIIGTIFNDRTHPIPGPIYRSV